jgi:hypothetical protein
MQKNAPGAAEDDVHGAGLAHGPDEALRAAHAWDDAQRHLWLHKST